MYTSIEQFLEDHWKEHDELTEAIASVDNPKDFPAIHGKMVGEDPEDIHHDNTYNYHTELDYGINYTLYTLKGESYMVAQIHRGGDYRGNYGYARVYTGDPDSLYELLVQ